MNWLTNWSKRRLDWLNKVLITHLVQGAGYKARKNKFQAISKHHLVLMMPINLLKRKEAGGKM